MTENPNLSPQVTHQVSLLGGAENMKLLFDDTMSDLASNRRAWDSFNLRVAEDAQVVKHLAQLNVVNSSQSGDTANQQTVSPIRTGAGDAVAAEAVPANRAIDASIAGIAQAADAISSAVAKLVDATNAVLVAAQGLAAKQAAGGGAV